MPRQTRHAARANAHRLATAGRSRRAVAIYARVSTDEQAERGYSLRDQADRLQQWCDREGVEVSRTYIEEGASAKTFERPEWNRLLREVESSQSPPFDTVLVVKWDRFSRDATGALGMIRRLEERGVAVQAVEQPIDMNVPEQLLMLAIYVAAPEVENRRRSLATKAGLRRAMKEGRYVNVPPKGYVRGRDEQDRFIIRPCPKTAAFVTEAFHLAAHTSASLESIRLGLRKQGFACSANQFTLLLRNPLYTGRIVVPAWGMEPETMVDGVHDALVTRETFEAVQERRFSAPDGRSCRRQILVDEIPLRGHLLCPKTFAANRQPVPLYGSGSRSSQGYRVWYYHGLGAGAVRYRASLVHERFEAWLDEVAVPEEVADLWAAVAGEQGQASAHMARARVDAARRALADATDRLSVVEERYYVERAMEADTFDRLRRRYTADAEDARSILREAEFARDDTAAQAAVVARLASSLVDVWRASGAEGRSALAGSIWPSGIVFDGESFRTTPKSPVIALFEPESPIIEEGETHTGPAFLSSSSGRI